jgi:phosphatidate cytidylyltransferase
MEAALRNRLTFGVAMGAVLIGLLYLDWALQQWTVSPRFPDGIGGIGLLAICLIVLPAATRELASLFAAVQVKPYRVFSAIGSTALAMHAFLTQFDSFRPYGTTSLALIVVSVMMLAALRRAWSRQTRDAIHDMAGTVLATMYLGGLAWFLIALRVKDTPQFRGSTMVILTVLLIVKSTDIGAYFGGRALGKHKLIPWLSPGKTWEGLVCGVATSAAVGAACAAAMQYFSWEKGLVFGAVIGAIGQVGDLLESMMKRDAAVKDSGTSIPGFGGVLDVIDSPLLAAPFAYLLFSIFARHG